MHAYHHLLTLTNSIVTGRTLRQPRTYTPLDTCELACRTPQAIRPPAISALAASMRSLQTRGPRLLLEEMRSWAARKERSWPPAVAR